MHTQTYANAPGYLFIIIGLVLSTVSALVPHFDAGYRLSISVFAAGTLPYMVYGIIVPLLRSTLTTVTGLIIVIAHAWLVFNERVIGHADYSDGVIYTGPILIAALVLPLIVIILIKQGVGRF